MYVWEEKGNAEREAIKRLCIYPGASCIYRCICIHLKKEIISFANAYIDQVWYMSLVVDIEYCHLIFPPVLSHIHTRIYSNNDKKADNRTGFWSDIGPFLGLMPIGCICNQRRVLFRRSLQNLSSQRIHKLCLNQSDSRVFAATVIIAFRVSNMIT